MRQILISLMIAALLVAVSCSGGNAVSPLTDDPGMTPGVLNHETQSQSHNLWGLWQFVADPEAGTLDTIQLRTGNFHLNALPFLESPTFFYLSLESLEFNGDIIETDIGIRHPFLGLTEFTGFDVSGIFITDGSVTGFDDPDLRMAGDGDTRLLNPDGYSRWWNPAEFPLGDTIFNYKDGLLGTPDSYADYNSTLNGYKYFCDDLAEITDTLDVVTLENRGMFSAGQKNVRHYTIDTSGGLIFNYAIDACWVFPDGASPWTAPEDFAPQANRSEAWNAVVKETENTLWNDGVGNGGNLSLQVDVYDWFDVELNSVKVESPGNFASVTSAIATGGGEGFSTYEIEIIAATPAEGSIDLLIGVVSEDVDYGGFLPGKTVTAYFGYEAEVDDEAPVAVEFPVLIDSDNKYWATRFVEDSNGVFHVAASWIESPNREMRWFISTDQGATWQSKGDLTNPPSIELAYSPPLAFQLAADQDGGVYLLYSENEPWDYSSSTVGGFLKYLDTSTAGTPAEWELSDWQSKRVFTLDYTCGAQNVAITISPSDQILMVMFDYRECDGDRGLKYNYASGGWASVVDGSDGLGVDSSLIASGTGDLNYCYPSGNNNVVYHPGTGHFFYCIGGDFKFEGSGPYVGVCALEFDPDAGANLWKMVAAFQNIGMTNGGSIMQNYHGDMAVDSAGDVHWVHASTYRFWTSSGWYYNNVQFRFVHGVRDNSTGVWDMSDTPINGTWDFPTPPPPSAGDSSNRYDYEPAYINLVHSTNGILLSWLQSHTYPNYQSSLLMPGGSFDDPPTVQLSASEYPIIVPTVLGGTNTGWASAQGEAVGDQLALPFASKEAPSDPRGQLWFTMFDDM